ncbi:hypothetical protein [Hamadaea tsunoensis]|uniref:hypothetical protein n=1 Tax=Hamadaea tsunoensis TaxID=53368 RepID=UPI0012FA0E16|nr:hypothetical protein [Hamadaea tsunoensis]
MLFSVTILAPPAVRPARTAVAHGCPAKAVRVPTATAISAAVVRMSKVRTLRSARGLTGRDGVAFVDAVTAQDAIGCRGIVERLLTCAIGSIDVHRVNIC